MATRLRAAQKSQEAIMGALLGHAMQVDARVGLKAAAQETALQPGLKRCGGARCGAGFRLWRKDSVDGQWSWAALSGGEGGGARLGRRITLRRRCLSGEFVAERAAF
ncbi:hypothetical protein [Afifella marina]|uniref:hypothetical protein n=1 Tax=Afifella marina TaxID=1080 RepID=UPI0030B82E70